MPVARSVTVDWCAYKSKRSVVKWDRSCFKGAYRHGPHNNATVKEAAQAFIKRLAKADSQLKGWP